MEGVSDLMEVHEQDAEIPEYTEVGSYETETDDYSDDYSDESNYSLAAQEQWEASINEVYALLNFILLPLIGKFLGRRTSKLVWTRLANWIYA